MLNYKKPSAQIETFNDGVLNIVEAKDGFLLKNKLTVRYGLQTIGVTRFYQAQVAGSTIDEVVSVPYNLEINRGDLVELQAYNGKKGVYRIHLLQVKDTIPRSMFLTLKKDDILYDDKRV